VADVNVCVCFVTCASNRVPSDRQAQRLLLPMRKADKNTSEINADPSLAFCSAAQSTSLWGTFRFDVRAQKSRPATSPRARAQFRVRRCERGQATESCQSLAGIQTEGQGKKKMTVQRNETFYTNRRPKSSSKGCLKGGHLAQRSVSPLPIIFTYIRKTEETFTTPSVAKGGHETQFHSSSLLQLSDHEHLNNTVPQFAACDT
jgi:hypothetical protein